MRLATIVSIIMTLSSTTAGAAMYKWIDADGSTQYGQYPPAGVQAERIHVSPPPASQPQAVPSPQQRLKELEKQQQKQAEKVIAELSDAGIWANPIVTLIEPFTDFYQAEDYHQEYFENNPNAGYCRVVIQPKVEKFEKVFRSKLK